MNKEYRKQIRAANKIISREERVGVAYNMGCIWKPVSKNAWRLSDRRVIKAVAKQTAKAFRKNADGTFRFCAKVRAEARRYLAEVIFNRADACLVKMMER